MKDSGDNRTEIVSQVVVSEDVNWFAAWTRSRHEASVLKQLQDKGIEAFLPTSTRWSRWRDRKKRIDWPLFPGYCFVRVPSIALSKVVRCNGVVSIVSSGSGPAPIPAHEIESVRLFMASQLPGDPCPLLHEGAVVEVTSGPLRGVVGRLSRKGTNARLVIAVGILSQGISVQVDAADVKPY